MATKAARRVEVNAKTNQVVELDYAEKGISSFSDIASIFQISTLTNLTLSHNKITAVPAGIAELVNLEMLNLWNNRIEELPTSISSMSKLRVLNLGMNRLWTLPRGFGSFASLEVLDVTYNNLSEKSLPGNFFMMETLRALYLSDNDFEMLPPDIRNLKNLQILVLRDNDLIYLPKEIGELSRLRELHIQGNRLTILPPEIGNLNLVGPKQIFRMDNNPWVTPILEQMNSGDAQLLAYLASETYKYLYGRHLAAGSAPPPRTVDKGKKNKPSSNAARLLNLANLRNFTFAVLPACILVSDFVHFSTSGRLREPIYSP